MNRRTFLTTAAVATAGLAAADDQQPLPIIDTHQHLWDLDKLKLPWLKVGSEPLGRSYTQADYKAATAGLNVVKAVYMEVDVAAEQLQAEADSITAMCQKGDTPTVAAVVGGRPGTDAFAAYAKQFKGSKYVKGIRQVLHGERPAGTCTKPEFVRDIRLLGDLGLTFDLCMRPADLPDAAKLAAACPDTRFVLDHCGNPDYKGKDISTWKRDLTALAKNKNVVCKVSGILASVKPGAWTTDDLAPVIRHVLDTFGPDRVLFAGDWPVCLLGGTFKQWVEAVRQIVADRPLAERKKLFHDNAAAYYGI